MVVKKAKPRGRPRVEPPSLSNAQVYIDRVIARGFGHTNLGDGSTGIQEKTLYRHYDGNVVRALHAVGDVVVYQGLVTGNLQVLEQSIFKACFTKVPW
jgi:hypothetical protein